MTIFNKPFDQLVAADLQDLITNQVRESKVVDYKRELKVGADADRKEFLADISSFANTVGGHLIIGMDEEKGLPTALVGISVPDQDELRQQLENTVRGGLAPRLPVFRLHFVVVAEGCSALVLHIDRSWAGPHMVTFKESSRFYARNSAGKFPLDVQEIRAAFVAGEEVGKRMTSFRAERVARVMANDTVLPLPDGAKVIAHLLPLAAFTPGFVVDLAGIVDLSTMPTGSSGPTPNFDGVVAFNQADPCVAYNQVFRSGCIEAVDARTLVPEWRHPQSYVKSKSKPVIPSTTLEQNLVQFVCLGLSTLRRLGVEPPVFACFALTNVRGYLLAAGQEFRAGPLHRDSMLLPEVRFEELDPINFKPDVARALRPAFDVFWNAFGCHGSMNYDEQGNWKSRHG